MRVTESTTHQHPPTFRFGVAEWLGLAALAFGSLHILLDFGIGLFPTRGPASAAVAAVFILTSQILLWWPASPRGTASWRSGSHGGSRRSVSC